MMDRKLGFLLVRKLEHGKNVDGLPQVMVNALIPYKSDVQTITFYNGTEFARPKDISKKLNAGFYFAHPYSSWERGCSENTNGSIRQYMPKKQTFDNLIDL